MNDNKMLIYSAEWNDKPSFRLIPLSTKCEFVEAIYNPEESILIVVSKTKTPKNKNKDFFYEYYIEEKEDILNFINNLAVNNDHPIIKELLT